MTLTYARKIFTVLKIHFHKYIRAGNKSVKFYPFLFTDKSVNFIFSCHPR